MKLTIDGIAVDAQSEMTLLELIKQTGLEEACLKRRPLAAKIAGEVFTLNYIP